MVRGGVEEEVVDGVVFEDAETRVQALVAHAPQVSTTRDTRVHTQLHTPTHPHEHTCTHIHTRVHMHTHVHTHADMHTRR